MFAQDHQQHQVQQPVLWLGLSVDPRFVDCLDYRLEEPAKSSFGAEEQDYGF
jgi:hypothetical protein